ncbi:guanylate cyclase activator 1d [Esox lucius]|uniref:guanylate cyclase activator 1d n=1 Tax=Esox lucius TaxID=8010 RepID=UPI0014773C84|nr:guanylate cyclase activator 1d [Esox lucius]
MGNHGSSLDYILAEDMHYWYNRFMKESLSELITLFELKGMLGLQGMNEKAASYVDQVFFTFDMDGSGAHRNWIQNTCLHLVSLHSRCKQSRACRFFSRPFYIATYIFPVNLPRGSDKLYSSLAQLNCWLFYPSQEKPISPSQHASKTKRNSALIEKLQGHIISHPPSITLTLLTSSNF